MSGSLGKFSNAKVKPYLLGIQRSSSVYGATVPVLYGRNRSPLYLIWARNLRQIDLGGKGILDFIFPVPMLLYHAFGGGNSNKIWAMQADFLIGHAPVSTALNIWVNGVKTNTGPSYSGLAFGKSTQAITPGTATATLSVTDAIGAYLIGITLTLPYSYSFDDYGAPGPLTGTGTYEQPLWNARFAGPDPVNASAYRRWPWSYWYEPATGPTIKLENNALGLWPACDLNFYYLLRNDATFANPTDALLLEFEAELGSGGEYGVYTADVIHYPHYAGIGSDRFNLGPNGIMPALLVETLGAHPLYPTGDCDYPDIIEDIFKGAQAQAAFGLAQGRTDVQHGLNCYEYPGAVQKKFAKSSSAITTVQYDQANTAGNFLVVFASSATVGALGISDAAVNSWTPMFGSGLGYQAWYATAVAHDAGNVLTFTGLGADSDVILLEVAGADVVDSVVVSSGTSATTNSSVTTTNGDNIPAYIVAITNLDTTETLPAVVEGRWPLIVRGPGWQWAQARTVYYPGTYSLFNALLTSGAWRVAMFAFKRSQPPDYPKPLGDILDRATLDLTRRQCRAYGLYGSLVMDSQKKASDWLDELYTCANAAPVWSGFKLKSIPYAEQSYVGNGATYDSPTAAGPIADLKEGDFIADGTGAVVTPERAARVDAPNILQMEHPARDNDYNRVVTQQPDQGSLTFFGPRKAWGDFRKSSPASMSCVQDSAIARMILGVQVRRENYYRNTYSFTLNAKWKLLEPMDLVTITDPIIGINRLPVRLLSVDEDKDYNLKVTARDFFYGVESPATAQATSTGVSPNPQPVTNTPASVNAPVILQPVVRLSNQQSQLWLVVSDPDPNYGGCLVYISTDGGSSYSLLSTINGNAVTGETVGTWPASADPDTTNDLAVNLTESLGTLASYPVADEDNFVYPCYVAGGITAIPYELMTYAVRTLTSAYHYTLSATSGNKLRRSVFGAPTVGAGVSHAGGSRFAFLNPTGRGILKLALDPSWIGKTLYFKFAAFNAYGSGTQALADCAPYSYTVLASGGTGTGGGSNSDNYTIDPNPCLSQPLPASGGNVTVNVAAVVAHFTTNDASYNARSFVVPDPGGVTGVVHAAYSQTINSMARTSNTMVVEVATTAGLAAGNRVYINGGSLFTGVTGVISIIDGTHLSFYQPGANASGGAGGFAQRGAIRLAGSTTSVAYLIDTGNIGLRTNDPMTVAGVADASFDGTYAANILLDANGNFGGYYYIQGALAAAVSGGGTIAGGPGNTAVYYVTVADPGYVGDAQGALTAYCETNQSKVGVAGYTYLGSIYVTHAGTNVIVTYGGWPAPQGFLVNGG